jgi:hypothetical protein
MSFQRVRRREFIAGLGGAAVGVAWGKRASATEPSSIPRVGFISGYNQAASADFINALRDGLAAYRYVEPHSLNLICCLRTSHLSAYRR